MEWKYGFDSKKSIIDALMEPGSFPGACLVGSESTTDNHWLLLQSEKYPGHRWIVLISMRTNPNNPQDYGYRAIPERLQPHANDCPVDMLRASTEPSSPWRDYCLLKHDIVETIKALIPR